MNDTAAKDFDQTMRDLCKQTSERNLWKALHPWRGNMPKEEREARRKLDEQRRQEGNDNAARYSKAREPLNRFSGRR